MPESRNLLLVHGACGETMRTAAYGDDFFVAAAPVWLMGAVDEDRGLVGLVGVRRQGRSAMGFALTVDPAFRSTGLSLALVATAVGHATSLGAEFLHAQANS